MDYTEIEDATLIKSTERAGLYRIEDRDVWIPWSLVDEGSVDKDGQTGTIYVAEWFVEREQI